MKICTQTHTVPSFGEIPEGSLWADDSPYVTEPDMFADVAEPESAAPVRKPPVRKFGEKKKVAE